MSDKRLRHLLQDVYNTHVEFHKEIAKGHRWVEKGRERSEIVVARARFHDSLNILFVSKLDPLRNSFLADPQSSVDEVIDFLEIDIPAFRCGYEKEWYLRKLKSIELSEYQCNRLRIIAFTLIGDMKFRREFRDWCRLMAVLANKVFLEQLQVFSTNENYHVKQKANWMIDSIINTRRDLHRNPQS